MKYLKIDWQKRLSLILLVSCLASVALYGLQYTDWAAQVNEVGYSHGEVDENGERKTPPWYLMLILPFVKQAVLIGVPALLFGGIWMFCSWLANWRKRAA